MYQSSQRNIQLKTFQGIVKNVPCHSLSVVFVAMLTPLSFAGKEWLKMEIFNDFRQDPPPLDSKGHEKFPLFSCPGQLNR